MSLETLSVDTKFYRSLLAMVRILRDDLGGDVEKAFGRVANQLADDLQLPLVWIGILEPGSTWVNVTAKAGSAWEYAQDLRISSLEHIPEGRGPGGKLLRLGEGVVVGDFLQSPEFAPWRELAYSFALKQNITSVKSTEDGNKIIMGAFLSGDNGFSPAIPSFRRVGVLSRPFRASLRDRPCAADQIIGPSRPGHRHTATPSLGRRRRTRLPNDSTPTMRHSTRLHSRLRGRFGGCSSPRCLLGTTRPRFALLARSDCRI
ncbi:GAF domain-containing protein [Acidithiobacillus sp. IBUN Pt1247-S3]|uniref:GAF domain-containing protein n=1 Tax=Acidithiobacillus sp. IBUN Pt1247-S3 TaxID=3166642 RepID=UPI0034E4DB09